MTELLMDDVSGARSSFRLADDRLPGAVEAVTRSPRASLPPTEPADPDDAPTAKAAGTTSPPFTQLSLESRGLLPRLGSELAAEGAARDDLSMSGDSPTKSCEAETGTALLLADAGECRDGEALPRDRVRCRCAPPEPEPCIGVSATCTLALRLDGVASGEIHVLSDNG